MELRTWQRDALKRWMPTRRGIVAVVTGGGKTRFALEVARQSLKQEAGLCILVLVPTLALQDQWLVEIEDAFPGITTGTGISNQRPPVFLVLTYDTARRSRDELDRLGSCLVIADECHRAASVENRKSLPERPWGALGLSATPERQYDDLFFEVLIPLLGPVIYEYSYRDALMDSVISPFDLLNYKVPITELEKESITEVTRKIVLLHRKNEGIESDRLKTLLMRRARLVQQIASREPVAVELAKRNCHNRSTIVFHESTDAADRISERLRTAGIQTSVYHSRVSPAERRKGLNLFRLGATSVLVCCRALDEGLNVPRAKFAVIAASTAASRQRIQRLGRILRPVSSGANAEIATLYATDSEMERLVAEQEMLEGVAKVRWLRAEVSN